MKDPFVPITPGDSPIIELMSKSEDEVWAKILEATKGMLYKNKADLINRGYTVEKWYGEY